jgi:hypothetical protein
VQFHGDEGFVLVVGVKVGKMGKVVGIWEKMKKIWWSLGNVNKFGEFLKLTSNII